jgi:hypothetical protein
LHKNRPVTDQQRIDLCEWLDQMIRLIKRLHQQRNKYISAGCDKFDWFNQGGTEAESRRRHEADRDNVDWQLKNRQEQILKYCPHLARNKLEATIVSMNAAIMTETVRAAWSRIPAPPATDLRYMAWGCGEDAARAFIGIAPVDVDISSSGMFACTPLFDLPPAAAAAYLGTFPLGLLRV